MQTSVPCPDTQPAGVHVFQADLRAPKPVGSALNATTLRQLIVSGEVVADLFTVTLAVRLGYVVYSAAPVGKHVQFPTQLIWIAGALFAIVMVMMLDRVGAYRRGNSLLRVRETEQVLRVSFQALVAVLVVSFFSRVLVPRWLVLISLALVPLLLFVQKTVVYLLVHALHSKGLGNERVLIYGAGVTGRRLFSVLKGSPKLGLVPVLVVDDDPGKAGSTLFEMAYERRGSAHVLGGPVTRELLLANAVDLVIIAIPSIGSQKFALIMQETLAANARVSFVPSHSLSSDSWFDYRDLDGILLASVGKPGRRLAYETAKRMFDFVVSLLLIIFGSPVLLAAAVMVKLTSAGPVLFRQERVGRNGKSFRMYKFRTMQTSTSPYAHSPRQSCDPRITGVGKFLRKTSLDELPQLFNVLKGSMSLVGPRPEMPFIVEEYTDVQRKRLQVTPGLTGLWQLSGDRAFLIHENIEYDLYYIQQRSFFMDIAVLLHTSVFAMRGV